MRKGLVRCGVATLAGLVWATAGAGSAWAARSVRFGANLNVAPLANAPSCGALGQPSCLGYSLIPTSYAPVRGGTVTLIRVRTANVPQGPMRVVLLRSYYWNVPGTTGEQACCFVKAYGRVFTPRPGAITAVKTRLPMIEQPVPPSGDYRTVAAADFIALEVLNSSTPVPLGYFPGSYDIAQYYAPAPNPKASPPGSALSGSIGAGSSQYELLLNAQITPVG